MLKTKNKHLRYVITFFAVLCSSLLQTFVIESFVHSAGLLSGGFTGVAILIDRAASLYGGSISTSLALVALNLPVAVLCYRSISPRFTLFSLLQVGMTSLFLKYFSLPPIFDDILLSAVFGGFLMGISIVLALKGNASTGGTDFIAAFVHKRRPEYSMMRVIFVMNTVVAIMSYFVYDFNIEPVALCIIYSFITTHISDNILKGGQRALKVEMITAHPREITDQVIRELRHSATIIRAEGGYSHTEKTMLICVINKHQITRFTQIISAYPDTFACVSEVNETLGNFKRIC